MIETETVEDKEAVRLFWNRQSCGEVYAQGEGLAEQLEAHAQARYSLEPYVRGFAKFDGGDKRVLEIGIGMGADHLEWAKSRPKQLVGIDLTPRAAEWTKKRLAVYGLHSDVEVADAECLPFADGSFDIVYAYGCLHHSPNTAQAIREVHRVLKRGGEARILIYHKWSLVGYMLWIRYALLTGRPWRSLKSVYAEHLESPGTKAFSLAEAREMCRPFSSVTAWTSLSMGDLLQGAVGQKHGRAAVSIAKRLWPRPLIRLVFRKQGLNLFISAVK